MQPITITAEQSMELTAAVESYIGEYPLIRPFRGRESTGDTMSLSYIGTRPGIVGFELCIMLVHRTAQAAYRSGYVFSTCDFVDEMRLMVMTVRSPVTEAVGRELVYYWPTVALLD